MLHQNLVSRSTVIISCLWHLSPRHFCMVIYQNRRTIQRETKAESLNSLSLYSPDDKDLCLHFNSKLSHFLSSLQFYAKSRLGKCVIMIERRFSTEEKTMVFAQTPIVNVLWYAKPYFVMKNLLYIVEPRLSGIRLTDFPDYPTHHSELNTLRYPIKIGQPGVSGLNSAWCSP